MASIAGASSVTFRVWPPHASIVFVTGSFNDWSVDAHLMVREENGCWLNDISSAKIGGEYRYRIINGDQQFHGLVSMRRLAPLAP
jgi:1,4-alpha-glucan branching enzyme